MNKLRKFVLVATAMLASSLAFVSCSDDVDFPKNTLGATFIQQITASTTSVDLRWTITPTDNVEGYLVQIYQGTRESIGSSPVASGTFEKKTATGSFTGLTPNTTYTVATQCIPAAGSKFTNADVAYFQFTTAPVLSITSVSAVVTQSKGELTGEPVVDAAGNPVYEAAFSISYSPAMTIQQVNGIYVWIEDEDGKAIVNNQLVRLPVSGEGQPAITNMPNPLTLTVPNITPGTKCLVSILPSPSDYAFYTTATVDYAADYEFTIPEAN